MNADIYHLLALKCDIQENLRLKLLNKTVNRWLSTGPATKRLLQLKKDYLRVKQNGDILRYVRDQTEEICLLAVKQDGHALYHVRNQTKEICLEAVKQNGYALMYVENKTYDIRVAASIYHMNAYNKKNKKTFFFG